MVEEAEELAVEETTLVGIGLLPEVAEDSEVMEDGDILAFSNIIVHALAGSYLSSKLVGGHTGTLAHLAQHGTKPL